MIPQDKPSQAKTRQDNAGQNMKPQIKTEDKTRQDNAGQDKTPHIKTEYKTSDSNDRAVCFSHGLSRQKGVLLMAPC